MVRQKERDIGLKNKYFKSGNVRISVQINVRIGKSKVADCLNYLENYKYRRKGIKHEEKDRN